MNSDAVTRRGPGAFRFAGSGVPHTRHCMPGQHHVSHQRGGTYIRFRGIRIWCCGECKEKRAKA